MGTTLALGTNRYHSQKFLPSPFLFFPPAYPPVGRVGMDQGVFKEIFLDHWENFKHQFPQFADEYIDSVIQKMLNCGDPDKMGYIQFICTYCGERRRIAFSCKSTFCLSCAKPYTDRWVAFIGRRLFPGVDYRHIVLTVPDFFRPWFLNDPKLLSFLMPTGHACLQDVFTKTVGLDLDIGTVIVLQTSGRSGQYNPHLHILATGGGLDSSGHWKPISFIPFPLLHIKWQYHLLTMLRQKISDPAINKNIDFCWRKYPNGLVAWVDKGKVPPGGKGLAKYLAKYLVSPPISIRRIEAYNGETVSYWYQEHKTDKIEHVCLPVLKFIHQMVQHILPKGFQRIRYYGLHAHVRYEENRRTIDELKPSRFPPDPRGFRVLPRKPFAQLFEESFGKDPLLCPRCQRRMEPELIFHPDYGVIKSFEKELYKDGWDDGTTSTAKAGKQPVHTLDRSNGMVQLPLPFM